MSDASVARAAAAYRAEFAASGSARARSIIPEAAMAAADESRGASGIAGSLKSQYGTMSAGRSAR